MRQNPTDAAAFGGRLNIYTCDSCRSHVVTRDVDQGVTPMFLPSSKYCPNKCEKGQSFAGHEMPASMTSSMYRVWDQSMLEDFQWYRPGADEIIEEGYREHVLNGGLLIRPNPAKEKGTAANV